MDIKKLGNLDSLQQPGAKPQVGGKVGVGPSFEDVLNGVQAPKNTGSGVSALQQAKINPANLEGVKFSNHAVERMMSRGIKFGPEDMQKLNDAVGRAAAKGSKDSLILMNESALIVSVKNKTVVTVMDKTALKENVFTNIDSTIVM